MRDAAQTFAHDGRLTDDKHFRGIAVETIFDYGDINVNDIAIFQQLRIVRDTVAHHFINRDANGFRIAVIAEAGRNRVLFINNVIITDAIQLAGADARFNIRFDHLQHFGSQSASDAHFSISSGVLIEIAINSVHQRR